VRGTVCLHWGHSNNFYAHGYVLVTTKKLVTTISHNFANLKSGNTNSQLKIIFQIVVTICENGEYH